MSLTFTRHYCYGLRIFVHISFSCFIVVSTHFFRLSIYHVLLEEMRYLSKENDKRSSASRLLFPSNEFCFYIFKCLHDCKKTMGVFFLFVIPTLPNNNHFNKIDLSKGMKILYTVHILYWNVKRFKVNFPKCYFLIISF